MIKVLYEDNHLIAVLKPINVPTQKDSSNDIDMVSLVKDYLKKKYNKPGNVYLGLLHRLDRPVSGVLLFAKTSKAAERMTKEIKNHNVRKTYYAVVEGKVDKKGTFIDKLLKDEKTNFVRVSDKGKEAKLEYELICYKNNYSLVKINLITGRSHQIRVQFSSRGYPLYGDQRYNKKDKNQIALFSSSIEFTHPVTKEHLTISYNLPNRFPFTLFNYMVK
ncbi:MAG: RluA family pseudouridine synthase [Bacillales bacterium]|nr:RluA family pseudouridine synthase [Bacillales bacterium]